MTLKERARLFFSDVDLGTAAIAWVATVALQLCGYFLSAAAYWICGAVRSGWAAAVNLEKEAGGPGELPIAIAESLTRRQAPQRPDRDAVQLEYIRSIVGAIRNDLGFAEWGTPEQAETILQTLISDWYAICNALAHDQGRPEPAAVLPQSEIEARPNLAPPSHPNEFIRVSTDLPVTFACNLVLLQKNDPSEFPWECMCQLTETIGRGRTQIEALNAATAISARKLTARVEDGEPLLIAAAKWVGFKGFAAKGNL